MDSGPTSPEVGPFQRPVKRTGRGRCEGARPLPRPSAPSSPALPPREEQLHGPGERDPSAASFHHPPLSPLPTGHIPSPNSPRHQSPQTPGPEARRAVQGTPTHRRRALRPCGPTALQSWQAPEAQELQEARPPSLHPAPALCTAPRALDLTESITKTLVSSL